MGTERGPSYRVKEAKVYSLSLRNMVSPPERSLGASIEAPDLGAQASHWLCRLLAQYYVKDIDKSHLEFQSQVREPCSLMGTTFGPETRGSQEEVAPNEKNETAMASAT